MGPFDDQLALDVTESGTYTSPAGATAGVAAVSVQESGVQTVFAGQLTLAARDARIAIGFTQMATRPQEGGRYTAADGLVWQLTAVVKHSLGSYWECTGRTFAVPGGLTATADLQRRNSDTTTTRGLSNPTWANLESSVASLLVRGAETVELAEPLSDTVISAQGLLEGFREIRAGDRLIFAAAPSTLWDVDGAEPYDPSLGVQVLNLSRRV